MIRTTVLLSLVSLSFVAPNVLFAQRVPGVARFGGAVALPQSQGTAQGDPISLTYSFVPDGTTLFFGGTSDLRSNFLKSVFPGGLSDYQPVFDAAVNRWGEVSGVSFQFEPIDDGNAISNATFPPPNAGIGDVDRRGDVRFSGFNIDGPRNTLAQAIRGPSGPNDIEIDSSDVSRLGDANDNFLVLRNVITHEVGHALGLFETLGGHFESSDTVQLLEPALNLSFDGPQYHDILSIQRNYGDIFESGVGNDTLANATSLGTIIDGGSVVLGESGYRNAGNSILFESRAFEIQPTEADFISIDDQSDTDVFEFTVDSAGLSNVILDVIGETYSVGAQSENNELVFDASLRSDLTLEVLDSSGNVLAVENANGFGGDEILLDLPLPTAGSYFVRVTGLDNPDDLEIGDTQFYGLSVDFTADSPVLLGDVNMDGVVDFSDIPAFIAILQSGGFKAEADIDDNGVVDFADIPAFIAILGIQ